VVVVYALARRLAGPGAAAWAAIFAAVSPLQIYQAQELRMYVLLELALLGYFYFLVRDWDAGAGRRWRLVAGIVMCGTAALYSHNLAIFTLVAPDVYLALRRDWRALRRLILEQAAMALLAAPWLILVPGQIAKIQAAFWTPRPGLLEVLQALIIAHTNLPVPSWLLPVAVGASLLALALVALEVGRAVRADRGLQALIVLAVIPPIALFAASYLMRPVFVPRAFLPSMVAYIILAGAAVARARLRLIGGLLAGFIIVPALAALPFQYAYAEFPRSPFPAASAYLVQVQLPGDVIVHDNKLSYFPMHFYAPELPQSFLMDEPGSQNDTLAPATQRAMALYPEPDMPHAVGEAQRVWFVVFDRAIAEYATMGLPVHPQLAWLMQRFRLVSLERFNDLRVYQFER
jgi:mannosyltransferase